MQIHSILQSLGLSSKATSMYLSLLGKQKMTVAEIARASGTKRGTCYEYLDDLLARNLIARIPRGKRVHYAAESPRKLLAEFKSKMTALETQLPHLLDIHDKATRKPHVRFYEGKKELRYIYDDMFKTVGDVQSIFPAAAFFENFTEEDYEAFDKAMGGHAIKSKDLFVSDRFYRRIKEIREKNGSENKIDKKLPDWFRSNVDVLIYSEKVALISLRDLSAIVIENKDIADLFRNLHAGLWKLS